MDQAIYQQWWQLHIRAARGESLSAGEQAVYEAGLAELDAEEKLLWQDANLDLLRRLKADVERLEATHAQAIWTYSVWGQPGPDVGHLLSTDRSQRAGAACF